MDFKSKSLTFSEKGYVVPVKWPTLIYLLITPLGGIACIALFGMISITIGLVFFYIGFVDFVVYV
jgi:hypothetical protein